MARRTERDSGGFGRKFATWTAVILLTVWAAREPAQAATVAHYLASIIASLTSHLAHGIRTRPQGS